MRTKKVNQKELQRLYALNAKLSEHFSDAATQSMTVWRGDWRAVQWAAWWIRETLAEAGGRPQEQL